MILLLVVLIFLIKVIDYLMQRFGIKTGQQIHEQQQDAQIKKLNLQFEKIEKSQSEVKEQEEINHNKTSEQINHINEAVGCLQNSVDEMREAERTKTRAQMKDRIGQAYRYYHAKGEINSMEKEALQGLIKSYEQAGGGNSFVHSKVLVQMQEWKLVDNTGENDV